MSKVKDCGMVFSTEAHLKNHMKTKGQFHTEGDPYPCLFCDDIFDVKEEYESHIRKEHDDFVSEVSLFINIECKSDILPDFCELCHKDKNSVEVDRRKYCIQHKCDFTGISYTELRLIQRVQNGFPIIEKG